MTGGFQSTLKVSVFHSLLVVSVIMIDGSKRQTRQLGFTVQSLCVIERCTKYLPYILTSSYSLHLPFLPEHVITQDQKLPSKHQACNQ